MAALSKLALTCYDTIHRRHPRAGWISNVVLTSCRQPGKRLKNLLERLDAGQEIAPLSFKMPYDGIFVDGIGVKISILDAPVDCRVEDHRLDCASTKDASA